MEPAAVGGSNETAATRLLASCCGIALCAAFFVAQEHDLLGFNGTYRDPRATALVVSALAATFTALPWLPTRHRVNALLGSSLCVGALVMGWLVPVPLLFTWFAVRVSRSARPNWSKLCLLFAVWLGVAVLGWFAPNVRGLHYLTVAVYWGALPAALICLVVERGRGQLEGVDVKEEWLYLLAIPRLVAPFVQPIGAARFIRSRRNAQTPRLVLGGLALGLYAIAGFVAIKYTHYSVKSSTDTLSLTEHGPRILRNMLRVYAYNSTAIFFAVSMFRLLGYDLGSGFRFPLLASSPSDLYRRWNYYFFEFATSIYYLPIVSWCRRRLPLWLAYVVSGYASFFLGMWVLDRAASIPTSRYGVAALAEASNWRELLAYLGVWSVVVWSQVLAARVRRLRRLPGWPIAARFTVLLFGVGVCVTLFCVGVPLY